MNLRLPLLALAVLAFLGWKTWGAHGEFEREGVAPGAAEAAEGARRADAGGLDAGDGVQANVREAALVEPDAVRAEREAAASPAWNVRVRLVDEAGAPIAKVAVDYEERLVHGNGSKFRGTSRGTDADGVLAFESDFIEPRLGADQSYELVVSLVSSDVLLVTSGLEVQGPRELPLDFGDALLARRHPFVAGRVVDEHGKGLSGASVMLQYQFVSVNGEEREPAVIDVHSLPEGGRIAYGIDEGLPMMTRTDAEGRFEVHGDSEHWHWFLLASHHERGQSERVPFTRGDTDLEVMLAQPGELTLTLAPDTAAIAGDVRVHVKGWTETTADWYAPRATTVTTRSSNGSSAQFETTGTLTWTSLRPGPHAVWLTLGERTLVEWEDVEILSGEPTVDARLHDIDLSGWLQRVELDVHGPGGEPVEGATYQLKAMARPTPLGDGRLSLVELPQTLLISAPGYMTATLEVDEPYETLTLAPQMHVTLRFAEAIPRTSAREVDVALFPKDHYSMRLNAVWTPVDGDVVRVPLEGLGPQSVAFRVTERSPGRTSSRSGALKVAGFTVGPDDAGRVFEITLDAAQRAELGLD